MKKVVQFLTSQAPALGYSWRFLCVSSAAGFRGWGLEFRVWGLGFGVWGLGFRVQSPGFRVWRSSKL